MVTSEHLTCLALMRTLMRLITPCKKVLRLPVLHRDAVAVSCSVVAVNCSVVELVVFNCPDNVIVAT